MAENRTFPRFPSLSGRGPDEVACIAGSHAVFPLPKRGWKPHLRKEGRHGDRPAKLRQGGAGGKREKTHAETRRRGEKEGEKRGWKPPPGRGGGTATAPPNGDAYGVESGRVTRRRPKPVASRGRVMVEGSEGMRLWGSGAERMLV